MKVTKQPKDKRKFMVRLVCIVLCVLMVGGVLTSALITMVSAKTSSEIRKELDALKSEAQEIADAGDALEEELAANETQTQTTIEAKAAIDQRISITEAEIENINQQIQQYNLLIAQKQSELEDALAYQEEMTARYKARLRAMEENGKTSYWSVLFKANSFSDLLSRIDSIHEVAEADQLMLKELMAISAGIEEDRKELEAEMEALEATKAQLAEKEKTLLQQREEADKLLLALAAEYDDLSDEYLANEAEEERLRQEIMDAQAEYEAALSAEEAARLAELNKNNAAGGNKPNTGSSGAGSSGGGSFSGFTNPLGYLNVTCSYGPRTHPLWGYQSFHYGVDLAAGQGTPIYAIASGTVTTATYGEANGYYVALSHGNGYGSLYAHMTKYTVSVGQYVSQGEIIGYVGSTGWSTGPHLHFEIHLNGAAVNPMNYIG